MADAQTPLAASDDRCVCGEINTRRCPVHGQGDVAVSSGEITNRAVRVDNPMPSAATVIDCLLPATGCSTVEEAVRAFGDKP